MISEFLFSIEAKTPGPAARFKRDKFLPFLIQNVLISTIFSIETFHVEICILFCLGVGALFGKYTKQMGEPFRKLKYNNVGVLRWGMSSSLSPFSYVPN